MTPIDRAVGTLLGLACGDAVGTTLEFRAPGTFEPITDMVGGGPFRLKTGEWTDDTSMALCLAESLLDRGELDLEDQLRRYVLWHESGYLSSNGRCFDIGITTRTQLARFQRTGEAFDPRPDEESAANGSLMRLGAVPIRWHGDPETAAERSGESSLTTHAARRPVDACRLMGSMVSALIGGVPFDEVTAPTFWKWGELHPAVADIAAGGWKAKKPPAIRGTGYCIDALEAALWSVAGASSFRDAVLRAANLGDDADTTAAIAGQLAGARWGASGIPATWRENVVAGERIVALACGLFVAGGAEFARTPWPHDEFVHAWWVEPGRLLAGEYPGHSDSARARHKVDLLVDAGVRTLVDLTTPADRLAPYQPLVPEIAEARGLDIRHAQFPIPDLDVVDDHQYDEVAQIIEDGLTRGAVYVHCWGGIGRTGTVIGCVLADDGLDYDAVIKRLTTLRAASRKANRSAPEMPVQHEVIKRRVARRSDSTSDPSDQEIERRLQAVPRQRWDDLWAVVEEIEQEAEHVTWGGGQQVDTTAAEGVERPVIQMPYAIYSEATERMIQCLYEVGAIVPFDWPTWDGVEHYRNAGLGSASVADAVRMVTAIIRADRFSDGTIGAMLEDGTLLASLERIRRWYEAERA